MARTALPLLLILALLPACGGGDDKAKDAQKKADATSKRLTAAEKRLKRAEARLRRDRSRLKQATTPTTPSQSGSPTQTKQTKSASGCPSGTVPYGTEACAKPGGASAGCGGDPYSTPKRGGGCIGPAHPPSKGPAKPGDCPAGQVPAGDTGACAPK